MLPVFRRVLHGLIAACLLAGCAAAAREASPQAALTAFADALDRGDLRQAYAMLSDDYRAEVTFDEFKQHLAQNPAETKELAKSLRARKSTRVHAEVVLDSGERVRLEKKADRFQIATPVTDFYGQDTPEASLDSFIRAVKRSRWDVVLDLMPAADREGLDAATLGKNLEAQIEELTRMVALLETARGTPIEIVGDRATMPYGESYTARFVLEDGRWKIEDPE